MLRDFDIYYPRPFLRFHADLIELWGQVERKWKTDKAKIEGLVEFIPRKFRIDRLIFKKEDRKGIEKAMLQASKEGCWVALRSCYLYQPLGKAPWIMGMKSRRAVRLFFEKRRRDEKRLWQGVPAHYDELLADPGLKEIIVMFNPKRLCPEFAKEHFVARIECFGEQVRVEMRLHTDQTRDIEADTERRNLIEIIAPLDYEIYLSKNIPLTVSFGRAYFKKNVSLDEKKKMKITIEMFDGRFGEFRLKNPKYAQLIGSHALKITHQVAKTIFREWFYPPFNLYYRLQALRKFGLGTVEIQGRIEKGKIDWMLVYGLRGIREVSKII